MSDNYINLFWKAHKEANAADVVQDGIAGFFICDEDVENCPELAGKDWLFLAEVDGKVIELDVNDVAIPELNFDF